MSRIVLMDGHSILRKAYYNVPVMTDPTGFHTNAIAGFLNILLWVTEREKPVYLSVIFGAEEDAERMPAGLREQMPVLREVLSAMDINILERAEMETAKLAGAVAGCLRARLDPDGEIVLVSGERDLLKFVSEQISVCLLETGGGETVLRDYSPVEVEAACGITPAQFPEWQALTEMAGIGRRTAGSLLGMYGSIENIYAHIDEISGQSIRECLTGRRADVAGGRALCAVSEDTAIDLPDNAMEAMELGSEGAVSLTPAAGAILRKLSLQDQLEQFGQCEHASKAPTLDIDRDLKIITVSTAEDVQAVFDKAIKAACAAVRLIHIRAKDPGDLGKKADGQMFLQMDAEEPVFGCLLCGGSEDERTIYYIESSSRISEAYIREQLERMLLTDQMSVSVFDVKNDYRDMVSAEKDRELSSDALTRQLFDCKIAAYLMNPLKSDYEIADVADEYLGIRLQKWSDLFGKADLNVIYRDRREECLSCLAKETYVLYKAKPLLEAALGKSSMDRLFRELEMPLTYVLFDMEREGILVKPEELKAYGEVLGGRIEELEKAIHAAAGENFNINSPKQLGEILFEKMELPGGKKTKTGYSTAADVLEKLAPEHPIVKDILEYRGLAKLKSTYADGLAAYIDAGNKIHTSFNQTITATGRLS
ncbi:MAG: DNA polymerase I, partial [Lachnospiraceae bacterium]|nr:DNA polymerase I [Lachnospiraceae bacterium]